MSDPSQQGISSAQLAAMQHGSQAGASGQGGLFGIPDTQGLFAGLDVTGGLFNIHNSNLGIFGQHKPSPFMEQLGFVAGLGFDQVKGHDGGDLAPAPIEAPHSDAASSGDHSSAYGTTDYQTASGWYWDGHKTSSSDADSGGGDGDSFLGRIRPAVLVYGSMLNGEGAIYGPHMSDFYGGGLSAPAVGRGKVREQEEGMGL